MLTSGSVLELSGPGGAEAPALLQRVAAILGAFDAEHRELTLPALVARCGLPRSTTHRTADRMIRLGWLDKPREYYRIGNRLFEIGNLAPIRHELCQAVLPSLQDLQAVTKTAVQLGVLNGGRVLVVEKVTGRRPVPMLTQVGGILPAYCTALGRALLAYSDAATVDAVLAAGMPRRTPHTLTTRTALLRELAATASRGWASVREESKVGVNCVAAPIFGRFGEAVAALGVTGPSAVVSEDRMGSTVRLAAAAASRAYAARR